MSEEVAEQVEVEVAEEVAEESAPEIEVAEGVELAEGEPVEELEEDTAPKMYEIIVDGEKIEVPVEELLKGYQKGSAANKRFQEAASKIKEAQELESKTKEWKEKLLSNPFEALQKAGLSYDAIRSHYEDVTYQMLQMDSMSDEEKAAIREKREAESLREKYERLQEEMQAKNKAEEDAKFAQEVAQHQQNLTVSIKEGLEAAGVGVTTKSIRSIALNMKTALEGGYDLSIEDAIGLYKEENQVDVQEILKSIPPEALAELLGKDKLNAIRKQDLQQIKNPSAAVAPKAAAPRDPNAGKENASSFFDNLRKSTYRS